MPMHVVRMIGVMMNRLFLFEEGVPNKLSVVLEAGKLGF